MIHVCASPLYDSIYAWFMLSTLESFLQSMTLRKAQWARVRIRLCLRLIASMYSSTNLEKGTFSSLFHICSTFNRYRFWLGFRAHSFKYPVQVKTIFESIVAGMRNPEMFNRSKDGSILTTIPIWEKSKFRIRNQTTFRSEVPQNLDKR